MSSVFFSGVAIDQNIVMMSDLINLSRQSRAALNNYVQRY